MHDNYTVVYSNGFLPAKAVCQFFGISESTLRDWDKKGVVKSATVDGLKRYNVREVDILYRSMEQKGQIVRIFPDSFYFNYEDPKVGRPIKDWSAYLAQFSYMEEIFKDVSKHKYSTDSLENYDFEKISRPRSPLSSHRVHFIPKSIHPMLKQIPKGWSIAPLEFEVSFDSITAEPVGKHDNKQQLFTVDYIRVEPQFILVSYGDKIE